MAQKNKRTMVVLGLIIVLAAAAIAALLLRSSSGKDARSAVEHYLDAYVDYDFEKATPYCDDEMTMTLLYDALPNDIYDYIDYFSEETGLTGELSEKNAKAADELTTRLYGNYIKSYKIGDVTKDGDEKIFKVTLTMGYDPHVLDSIPESSKMNRKFDSYDQMVETLIQTINEELDKSKETEADAKFYTEKPEDKDSWLVMNLYLDGYSEDEVLVEQGDTSGDTISEEISDDSNISPEDAAQEEAFNDIEDNEMPEVIVDDEE